MTPGRGECPLCGIEVSGVRDENDRFLPIRGAGHLDSCLYSKSMMGDLEKTGPKRLRRVYLESPWAGDTVTNYAYAIRAMLDCLRRGEAPFASHIFYAHSGVLDDLVPAERTLGIQAGLAWALAMLRDLGSLVAVGHVDEDAVRRQSKRIHAVAELFADEMGYPRETT